MCIVSMVYDNYKPIDYSSWTITPSKTPLDLFEALVEAAKRLDEALGLADCEDPSKMEWLEKVKQQVRDHEVKKVETRLSKRIG